MNFEEILSAYELAKFKIDHLYNHFFNEAPTNNYGETDADFILMLNDWYGKKMNDLNEYLTNSLRNI